MIYIDDNVQNLDLTAALAAVSDERRQVALRYRQERDQRLCLAAYLLLQRAVCEQYGIRRLPPFIFGPHGKPSLAGMPHIHFNMSHSRGMAVCAVSDRPVGIDVERIDHYDAALIARTMNEQEQRAIEQSADRNTAFIRLWTMKESLLKLTGEGISRDLHTVLDHRECYRFCTTTLPDHIITVCHPTE
ncbi:MAG: 4'-phosphopantetheinyl transferase superfamily protein [Muribaculaceae bacterium]|nr:4'-phosphopantetheinyl transferase superfamily protein [Muribaculaceae bacterium]